MKLRRFVVADGLEMVLGLESILGQVACTHGKVGAGSVARADGSTELKLRLFSEADGLEVILNLGLVLELGLVLCDAVKDSIIVSATGDPFEVLGLRL